MRTVHRAVIGIGLLALAGCATTPALDRPWVEVSSRNFAIHSTLAEPDARRLIEDLELFRATLLAVTRLRDATPRVPTEIYAFERSSDYAPFRPGPHIVGYFVPTLRNNLVALSAGEDGVQSRVVLFHEYAHFLLRNEARRSYPMWFDEGFAELLSSVDVLGALVRVGIVPSHRVSWLLYAPKIPYSRVLGARSFEGWSSNDVGSFYAQSWLLVHYLALGQGGNFTPRLDRYLDQIGQGVPVERAFPDAFGIDVDDLGGRLEEYAKKVPSFGLPRRDLAKDLAISVRRVPVDVIGNGLGWLAIAIGKQPLARDHFERALAANPTNARAIAGIAEVDKFAARWSEAETGYQRSLELAPDDWQNQLEYAEYFAYRAQQQEADREANLARAREGLARAIDLAPDIPEGHAMLGVTYAIGQQPSEPGIAPLERAARMLPANPMIEFPLAQLHQRAGHRARAIELLRRVVNQPHGEANPDAVALLDQLEHEARDAEQPRAAKP
jgi:tetratricopeptide (TPR) repeat protein